MEAAMVGPRNSATFQRPLDISAENDMNPAPLEGFFGVSQSFWLRLFRGRGEGGGVLVKVEVLLWVGDDEWKMCPLGLFCFVIFVFLQYHRRVLRR
jgi:hypothetical protein